MDLWRWGMPMCIRSYKTRSFRSFVTELTGSCKPPNMNTRNGLTVRTATTEPSLHTLTISLFQAMTTFT